MPPVVVRWSFEVCMFVCVCVCQCVSVCACVRVRVYVCVVCVVCVYMCVCMCVHALVPFTSHTLMQAANTYKSVGNATLISW